MSGHNYYIKPGDIITVAGLYKKRTFWEWITRKPKELRQFVIGADFKAISR